MFLGGKGRSQFLSENLLMHSRQIHGTKLRHSPAPWNRSKRTCRFNLSTSAIWLTIERNKTLTLRVEIFQKGDIAEQRNKKTTQCSFTAVATFSDQL